MAMANGGGKSGAGANTTPAWAGQNTGMAEAGAEVCLAFIRDSSPSASDTAELARLAGIPTMIHPRVLISTVGVVGGELLRRRHLGDGQAQVASQVKGKPQFRR